LNVDENVGVLVGGVDFGIDKETNGERSYLVGQASEVVDDNFDGEQLTSYRWLHMMQGKHFIDMLLFGERNSIVFGNQVERNFFAVVEVNKKVENEDYDVMPEAEKGVT